MNKMLFIDEFPRDVTIDQKVAHYSKVFEANIGTKAHTVLVNLHQHNGINTASGLPVIHSRGINGNVFCLVGE